MNWQEIIVASICIVALFYLGKRIFSKIKKQTDAECDKCGNEENKKE